MAAWIVRRQRVHELRQHLQVRLELPHVVVANREVSPAQLEQRGVAGGQPVTNLRRNESLSEDVGVRGGLHEERHLLAACGRRHDGHVSVPWVNALQRAPQGVVHERLGLESGPVAGETKVEQRFDSTPGPFRRYDAFGPDPQRRPRRAPDVTDRDWVVACRGCVAYRDRFARDPPAAEPHRGGGGVDRGRDPLVQHPVDSALYQATVVVHADSR